jgi:hypothetical protein
VRFCIVRPRFFIELAFHHPQCGWFYRLNVTGLRKKNCGFNFRCAKKSFRNIASVSLYQPRTSQEAQRLRLICPCDLACGSFWRDAKPIFPTRKHWISNEQY